MSINFFEIPTFLRLLLPNGVLGWLIWALLIAAAVWLVRRFPGRNFDWNRDDWIWLLVLGVAVPISIVAVTARFPVGDALPIPKLGVPAIGHLLAFLAAIPWVFAIRRLGTLAGVLLATFSGALLGFWDTHSLFTPLEFALIAALSGAMLSQDYRTRFFSWVRQPVIAGIASVLIYPFLFLVTCFFWVSSDPIYSLDFALSHLAWVGMAFGIPILVASLVLQILSARAPQFAAQSNVTQPAPAERSLEARILFTLGPVLLLAFLVLAGLGWWVANRAADQLYTERIASSARLAAGSVPFLLDTGQSLMSQLAEDKRLADASQAEVLSVLQSHLQAVPYFEQLLLLDTGAHTIVSFPLPEAFGPQSDPQEIEAVGLALQGLPLQYLAIPPADGRETGAQLSYIAAVRNSNNQVRSILIGRTSLETNPFAQPILQNLESIDVLGGQGMLLDGNGNIVISPIPEALLHPYDGETGDDGPVLFRAVGPDGLRRQVHYQPVTGSNWAVVVEWPLRITQRLALSIALPILAALLILAAVAYLLLRASIHSISSSLQDLVVDTHRIAEGDLAAPLTAKSADEVGRLSAAFEQMRQTLQARIQETQRLLSVSQEVSGSLDIRSQIDPILDAAMAGGAISARLVFREEGKQGGVSFGRGEGKKIAKSLDAQMLALTAKQSRVLLTNPARAQLKLDKGDSLPRALAGFALRHDNENLGTLWLAFDAPQNFKPDQIRYLETLADQASKATMTARLYVNASGTRQRLEALLNAARDLVLLADEAGKIVFANLAATDLLRPSSGTLLGSSLTKLLHQPNLFEMVLSGKGDGSTEATIAGRIYQADYSAVEEDGKVIGRALILRDISAEKQLEKNRAESLAALSHDLQDPMELTKGYLSMLNMVGDLNEQQTAYLEKIERNIENIQRLSVDMLDLERLASGRGLQIRNVSLLPLIQESAKELEPRARQKKLTLRFPEADKSAPLIEADPALLQRAFYNLLDNAIKVSPREGQVDIRISYQPDAVKISLRDRGGGIAPFDLPKVFDEDNRRRTVGLAIVKSVIERHGGRVWVESELGTGSTFFCELPIMQPKRAYRLMRSS